MLSYMNPYIHVTTFSRDDIACYCRNFGPQLNVDGMRDADGQALSGVQLMWAVAGCESSFGHNCTPRFESVYFTGGRYSTQPPQPELIRLYGKAAACSYGPWQVMFCNCCHRVPVDLNDLESCAVDFAHHANGILKRQMPPTLDAFADAYNSGNWHDAIRPEVYIGRCRAYYNVPLPEVQNG